VSVSSAAVEAKVGWRAFFTAADSGDKEGKREFTLNTTSRAWIFQCDTVEKCSTWCRFISSYIGVATGEEANGSHIVDDEGLGDDSDGDE
jgi:hypothetical protein